MGEWHGQRSGSEAAAKRRRWCGAASAHVGESGEEEGGREVEGEGMDRLEGTVRELGTIGAREPGERLDDACELLMRQ
jgi:hypothetical protein